MKLSEAIAHFGTEAELARQLGIRPQAVYQWRNGGDPEYIPEGRQTRIELITRGKLKADPISTKPKSAA